MPLLKGRPCPPVKVAPPLKGVAPSVSSTSAAAPYVIAHTGERFSSKDEYEKRVALYEDPVWTCQCTGTVKLTHCEATESEQKVKAILKDEFPVAYEKSVLEIVHHNTNALELLVDEAYRRLHEVLSIGETVSLKVSVPGKSTIRGSVIKVDSPSSNKSDKNVGKAEADADSPKKSPPKLLAYTYGIKLEVENKIIHSIPANDLQREVRVPKKDYIKLFIRANALRASTHPNSPWVVDTRLVEKYSLHGKFANFLMSPGKANGKENSDASSMKRKRIDSGSDAQQNSAKKSKTDPQSGANKHSKKDDIAQGRPTPDAVASKKESMPSKLSNGSPAKKSLWPSKNGEKARKVEKHQGKNDEVEDSDEESMLVAGGNASNDAKHAGDKDSAQQSTSKKSSEKSVARENGSAKKLQKGEKKKLGDKLKKKRNSSSTIDVGATNLAKSKELNGSSVSSSVLTSPKKDAQVTLYRLVAPLSPPKKMKQVTLYQLVTGKKSEKADKSLQKTPTKKSEGSDKSPHRSPSKKVSKKDSDSPKYSLVKKTPQKGTTPSDKKTPTKDRCSPKYSLVKKTPVSPGKSAKSTPKKSTPAKDLKKVTTPRKPVQPVIVQRLQKLNRDTQKLQFSQFVSRCARELTEKQVKALPADLIDIVTAKFNGFKEKEKIEKMSPEEREAYLLKKKEVAKMKAREMMKKKWAESRKRFEDTELKLTPLPTPKIVATPDGLANELFGEVVMVTEFILSYRGLLMPEDKSFINAELLMQALVLGEAGFAYIARIICILLQTLLQDQLAEDYKELNVPMSQLPVNEHTCSELMRLCLRKHDLSTNDDDSASQRSDDSQSSCADEDEELEELIEQMESCEFHELDTEVKVRVLAGLCHRVMGTYSVQDYMDEKHHEAAELWKKKIASQKEENDKKKVSKEKKKNAPNDVDQKSQKVTQSPAEGSVGNGLTINNFYGAAGGKDLGVAAGGNGGEDGGEGEEEDKLSGIKRRRLNAAKIAEERRQKEEERRLCKEREYNDFKQQKEKESFEKQFKTGIDLSKKVFRHFPLGVDRNHDRYWVFSSSPTGIYIEKGWTTKEMGYSVQAPGLPTADCDAAGSADESDDASQAGAPEKRRTGSSAEKTFPRMGQNLWFVLDAVGDLDALIGALHPLGARENSLREQLMKNRDDVVKMMTGSAARKESAVLTDAKKSCDLVEGLRAELLDTEMRVSRGGLGGVPDFDAWEARLNAATEIPQFMELIVETQKHILEKFLHGMFAEKQVKVKPDSQEDSANEPDKEEEDERKRPGGMARWLEALHQCTTFSRFHVLLGILDSCVNWEKSVENVKCRICRKKGDEDDHLLLCDECNQPYHLYCLRPALFDVPSGEWYCASCAPEKAGRRSRVARVHYTADNDSDANENEKEVDEGIADVIEHDSECTMCRGATGDGELVPCSTCPSAFHLDCHDPPLRRAPRANTWKCVQCKTGRRIKRSSARSTSNSRSRKRPRYMQSDEDDDDDEDYSTKPSKKSSRPTKKSSFEPNLSNRDRASRRKRIRTPSSDSSGTEEEEVFVSRKSRCQQNEIERRKDERVKKEDGRRSGISNAEDCVNEGTRSTSRGASKGEKVDQQVILEIISRLIKHRSSWPFLEPVDLTEVPDYYAIVKNPIDLQTIENKCISDLYRTSQQFVDDVALMMRNADQYNEADSPVSKCIQPMEKYFESMLSKYLPRCKYARGPPSRR